jgi:hypothetical protein
MQMAQDVATCMCYTGIDPFTKKEAIEARRRWATGPAHYRTVANPAAGEAPGEHGLPNKGYRPGR